MQKPEEGNAIIKIQNVSKHYHKLYALHDFTLEIPRGAIYGFIGPNGAGKSTLLRILAALISPSSGEVWFDNDEVSQQSFRYSAQNWLHARLLRRLSRSHNR